MSSPAAPLPLAPCILATPADWEDLRARLAADPITARLAAFVRRRAASLFDKAPVVYVKEGHRLLEPARQTQSRLLLLGLAARLEQPEPYLAQARREIAAALAQTDWNPAHFLDTAELALGLALARDWFGPWLSAAEHAAIEDALIARALRPSFEAPPAQLWWIEATSNWNQVCHAGLAAAAIVVAHREPELAQRVLTRALAKLPAAGHAYAPDGAYPEGPMYWAYGTCFHLVLLELLRAATGSEHGLADFPGFLASAEFMRHTTTPTGRFFNYADCRESRPLQPALFWFASRLKDPSLIAHELAGLDAFSALPENAPAFWEARLLPLALLWWRPAASSGSADPAPASKPSPSRVFQARGDAPIAVLRSAWDDPRATCLALKGGRSTSPHGHQDIGSFVLEAGGVRWALDLGLQDYHSVEKLGLDLWSGHQSADRWTLFRLGPEGHNLLRIDGAPLLVDARAEFTRAPSDAEPATELDLTPLYGPVATRVARHAALLPDASVRLTDSWLLTRDATLAWQWITAAAVTPIAGGLMLEQDGEKLALRVTPEPDAAWTWRVEESEALLAPRDTPLPGVRRIVLTLPARAGQPGRLRLEARLLG